MHGGKCARSINWRTKNVMCAPTTTTKPTTTTTTTTTKPTTTTTTKPLNNTCQSRPILHGPPQSQFRFDNECYLNLPDNHKRVSISDAYAAPEDQAILALTLPITGDSVEQSAFDYASVAALSAFMPSVTSAQLIASSMGPSAGPAAVDEPNFVSVSMLFLSL